jgi:hypothetical protein
MDRHSSCLSLHRWEAVTRLSVRLGADDTGVCAAYDIHILMPQVQGAQKELPEDARLWDIQKGALPGSARLLRRDQSELLPHC